MPNLRREGEESTMNPEPEYPYPNWKGRPTGDPAEVIKTLRQCRKAVGLGLYSCTMPREVNAWAGHYHGLGKKQYRRLLGERLEMLYGSLPDAHLYIGNVDRDNAWVFWNALVKESRIYGRPDFYGDLLAPSEPLPAAEEPDEPDDPDEESPGPIEWMSREELADEHKRLRWALVMLNGCSRAHLVVDHDGGARGNFLRDAIDIAQGVLDATE